MAEFALTPRERATKDAEITQLSNRLEEMTDERDYWKDQLKLRGDRMTVSRLICDLKLQPFEAELVATLIRRYPKRIPLSAEDLDEVLPGGDHTIERNLTNLLAVYLCKLRKKLDPDFFRSVRTVGIYLTEQGYKALVMLDSDIQTEEQKENKL